MTCIGNSGPLSEPVSQAIEQVSLITLVCIIKDFTALAYIVGICLALVVSASTEALVL